MNALRIYRISNWFFRMKCYRLATLFQKINVILFKADISPSCTIKKGVVFGHFGMGLVINDCVTIEENVILYHNITIGRLRKYHDEYLECEIVIGSNTLVGANSMILVKKGLLSIGIECNIAAGSIVLQDVPSFSTFINPQTVKILNK
jgi:serine O-acetyltransferase